MADNSLILQQIDYFKRLSEINGYPVFVFDGNGHKGFFGKNKHHYQISSLHKKGFMVQDRLRFNGQEIIFDPDCSWFEVKKVGDKILDFLNKNQIPYEILFSGRNIRIHIYVNDSLKNYARSRRIDAQKMCFYLYQHLCYLVGIDWREFGVPENKAKNHLLGTIGKRNAKTGFYCTYIKEIPQEQPQTNLSDVRFPEKLKFWDIPQEPLDKAFDYSSKIPEQEVQKTFVDKRYFGAMTILRC